MRGQAAADRSRLLPRTLADVEFDGDIPVRRYLCHSCKRTVSLLPQFALPFLRFSIPVISLFLIARLLNGYTLQASAQAAAQPAMPYQRGQLWSRRFQRQAESLCLALAALTALHTAPNFVTRALRMLQTIGWTPAHRFLFSELARTPVGLASVSRSRRPSRRAPAGFPVHLRLPTQHLHSLNRQPRVSFSSGRFLMDAKAEKLALFRYGLIAPLVLETLPRGELTRRAEEIAARQYDIPDSQRISVSVDTLLEWTLRYRSGGFDALAPKPRQDRGQSRAITPQLADLIERLKRENPHRTGMTLLRELALTSEQNEPGVSASTLYRFLKQRGLTERQLLDTARAQEVRSPVSNQIWQADMLFGPYVQRPGGGKMQAFLHAILDDASRLIPACPVLSQPGTRCLPRLLAPSHRQPAACPCGSTSITPRSIAPSNWPASPPRSAF